MKPKLLTATQGNWSNTLRETGAGGCGEVCPAAVYHRTCRRNGRDWCRIEPGYCRFSRFSRVRYGRYRVRCGQFCVRCGSFPIFRVSGSQVGINRG
jgi:hypothetical protein